MIATFVAVGTISAFACSAVYVGKDVSSDGSTIIARSEDQGQRIVDKRWQVFPASDLPGRSYVTEISHIKVRSALKHYCNDTVKHGIVAVKRKENVGL